MIPIESLQETDPTDILSFSALAREASCFLERQPACAEVIRGFFDIGWEGIVAVFWFEVKAVGPGNPKQTCWVITGDLPPAHISNTNPNGASALDAYIHAMEKWVHAARNGKSVEKLIPVNVPATREWADKLSKRLDFIKAQLLPEYQEIICKEPFEDGEGHESPMP